MIRGPRGGGGGGDPVPFIQPEVSELALISGFSLRADSEQQQQQQQQQQQASSVRRFLDTETMLPQEEVVTKLSTEIRQINRIAPRQG